MARPVDELLDTMTSSELSEWVAYSRLMASEAEAETENPDGEAFFDRLAGK
jgi:hypothetical protein